MDTIQPVPGKPGLQGRGHVKAGQEKAVPAGEQPFAGLQERLDLQSAEINEKMKQLTGDVELHNSRYQKLNRNLNRIFFGVFTPSMFGAMFIPGGQLICMSIFLTTAAAIGGMAYLRSREEKELRADYEELRSSTEQKKALDRQLGQVREFNDIAERVKAV